MHPIPCPFLVSWTLLGALVDLCACVCLLVCPPMQAHPNSNAVLLTTETVTPCYYKGHDKHRMVSEASCARCMFSRWQLLCFMPCGPGHG